jgi:SAM-dependent methyltransferase
VQEEEMNRDSVDAKRFKAMYASQPPWDIGRPQKVFVDVAEKVSGPLLDVGCGTGENALFFGKRGLDVLGIDFLEEPIEIAIRKAAHQGLDTVAFKVMDALRLTDVAHTFHSIIDCGLFHVFNDADRRTYVEGLASVLVPDGRLFLLCFSDDEPEGQGPRRVSRKEIENAFAEGWEIESIEPCRFEVRPDRSDMGFSEGGPRAWFMMARRAKLLPAHPLKHSTT